jgi:transcriptional regulator with XRE-family HTH domain
MNYSQELLKMLQAKTGKSINQIAKNLGKSQPYISMIAKGKTKFSNKLALKIGKELGLDESQVLAKNGADKASTEDERKAWEKLLTSTAARLTAISFTSKAVIINCVKCIFIPLRLKHLIKANTCTKSV